MLTQNADDLLLGVSTWQVTSEPSRRHQACDEAVSSWWSGSYPPVSTIRHIGRLIPRNAGQPQETHINPLPD